jgi:hypothetical protein
VKPSSDKFARAQFPKTWKNWKHSKLPRQLPGFWAPSPPRMRQRLRTSRSHFRRPNSAARIAERLNEPDDLAGADRRSQHSKMLQNERLAPFLAGLKWSVLCGDESGKVTIWSECNLRESGHQGFAAGRISLFVRDVGVNHRVADVLVSSFPLDRV